MHGNGSVFGCVGEGDDDGSGRDGGVVKKKS